MATLSTGSVMSIRMTNGTTEIVAAKAELGTVQIVTTEEVLTEFLAAMSHGGVYLRKVAVEWVRFLATDSKTRVIPQSHLSFQRGLELYANCLDKEYSLVDCISMNTMREEGITEILTNDHHFTQEGFRVLVSRP